MVKKKKYLSKKLGACLFCNSEEDNELKFGKLIFHEKSKMRVHHYCLLFASGLCQRGEGNEVNGIEGFLVPDILEEYKRGNQLRCVHCHNKTATVGCVIKACRSMYHYGCGLEHKAIFLFYDNFISYCHKHRPQQDQPEVPPESPTSTCFICLENVEAAVSEETMRTPCCNNTWFHRICVQRQALSAGYFFRCGICNNKEDFQREMRKFGIYIPEQDAAWELEDNAYQELYQRHNQCDISPCICPKGRKHHPSRGKWEIVLCDTCGSRGCHLTCGGLTNQWDDWVCDQCSDVVDRINAAKFTNKSSTTKKPSAKKSTPKKAHKQTVQGKSSRTPLKSRKPLKKSGSSVPLTCPSLSPPSPSDSAVNLSQLSIHLPSVSASPNDLTDVSECSSSSCTNGSRKGIRDSSPCKVTSSSCRKHLSLSGSNSRCDTPPHFCCTSQDRYAHSHNSIPPNLSVEDDSTIKPRAHTGFQFQHKSQACQKYRSSTSQTVKTTSRMSMRGPATCTPTFKASADHMPLVGNAGSNRHSLSGMHLCARHRQQIQHSNLTTWNRSNSTGSNSSHDSSISSHNSSSSSHNSSSSSHNSSSSSSSSDETDSKSLKISPDHRVRSPPFTGSFPKGIKTISGDLTGGKEVVVHLKPLSNLINHESGQVLGQTVSLSSVDVKSETILNSERSSQVSPGAQDKSTYTMQHTCSKRKLENEPSLPRKKFKIGKSPPPKKIHNNSPVPRKLMTKSTTLPRVKIKPKPSFIMKVNLATPSRKKNEIKESKRLALKKDSNSSSTKVKARCRDKIQSMKIGKDQSKPERNKSTTQKTKRKLEKDQLIKGAMNKMSSLEKTSCIKLPLTRVPVEVLSSQKVQIKTLSISKKAPVKVLSSTSVKELSSPEKTPVTVLSSIKKAPIKMLSSPKKTPVKVLSSPEKTPVTVLSSIKKASIKVLSSPEKTPVKVLPSPKKATVKVLSSPPKGPVEVLAPKAQVKVVSSLTVPVNILSSLKKPQINILSPKKVPIEAMPSRTTPVQALLPCQNTLSPTKAPHKSLLSMEKAPVLEVVPSPKETPDKVFSSSDKLPLAKFTNRNASKSPPKKGRMSLNTKQTTLEKFLQPLSATKDHCYYQNQSNLKQSDSCSVPEKRLKVDQLSKNSEPAVKGSSPDASSKPNSVVVQVCSETSNSEYLIPSNAEPKRLTRSAKCGIAHIDSDQVLLFKSPGNIKADISVNSTLTESGSVSSKSVNFNPNKHVLESALAEQVIAKKKKADRRSLIVRTPKRPQCQFPSRSSPRLIKEHAAKMGVAVNAGQPKIWVPGRSKNTDVQESLSASKLTTGGKSLRRKYILSTQMKKTFQGSPSNCVKRSLKMTQLGSKEPASVASSSKKIPKLRMQIMFCDGTVTFKSKDKRYIDRLAPKKTAMSQDSCFLEVLEFNKTMMAASLPASDSTSHATVGKNSAVPVHLESKESILLVPKKDLSEMVQEKIPSKTCKLIKEPVNAVHSKSPLVSQKKGFEENDNKTKINNITEEICINSEEPDKYCFEPEKSDGVDDSLESNLDAGGGILVRRSSRFEAGTPSKGGMLVRRSPRVNKKGPDKQRRNRRPCQNCKQLKKGCPHTGVLEKHILVKKWVNWNGKKYIYRGRFLKQKNNTKRTKLYNNDTDDHPSEKSEKLQTLPPSNGTFDEKHNSVEENPLEIVSACHTEDNTTIAENCVAGNKPTDGKTGEMEIENVGKDICDNEAHTQDDVLSLTRSVQSSNKEKDYHEENTNNTGEKNIGQ